MESEEWFKPLNNLLYKSKNGRVLMDNSKRYAYYSKSVLSTLPHLFWVPDIFVCNSWQSALIPSYYKNEYEGINDFYKKIKTVLVIHDLDEYSNVERSELVDLGVEIHPDIKGNKINISIGHAIAEEEALYLKKYLQSKVPNVSEFKVTELGTAIGVHGGPGAIVVGVQILS